MTLAINNCSTGAAAETFVLKADSPSDQHYWKVMHKHSGLCATALVSFITWKLEVGT